MPFVKSRDGSATLNWQKDGASNGLTVVFGNSLGTDLTMWDGVVAELADSFALLRLDARGHGQTRQTTAAFTIDDLASDVLQVMEAAGVGEALYVGLSMGGVIGQSLALSHPDRFTGFVLANTAAKVGNEEGWAARIASVRSVGLAALAANLPGRWFSADFVANEPEMVARLANMTSAADVDGYCACCAALGQADYRDAAWPAGTAVTVIASTLDVATTHEDGEKLAAGIPGARLFTLPTGHISAVEQPSAFARIIRTALPATSG